MKNQPTDQEQPKFVPAPAESFAIEFLSTKIAEVQRAMSEIGNFSFRSSGPEEDENSVYFKGERDDGTKIKIIIEKGNNYKSPAEIERIEREETASKKES